MATKRSAYPAKKGSKKGASKKGASKKSASKKGVGKRALVPPVNLSCIRRCTAQFTTCLLIGRPLSICLSDLQRCVRNCLRGD